MGPCGAPRPLWQHRCAVWGEGLSQAGCGVIALSAPTAPEQLSALLGLGRGLSHGPDTGKTLPVPQSPVVRAEM